MGRCHNTAPRFDKQRVAGDGTQLVQQVAHCRLADSQALRGASDRTRLYDGQQQLKKMSVKV
jgi:hypothetical protein